MGEHLLSVDWVAQVPGRGFMGSVEMGRQGALEQMYLPVGLSVTVPELFSRGHMRR